MNLNSHTNKKDKLCKEGLKKANTSQESLWLIREKDRDIYLNSYKPLVKTQYGFIFMKYPQVQLGLIVIVHSLLYYFMSDSVRSTLLIIYAVFAMRLTIGYIVKNILVATGLDELNYEIEKFLERHKGFVLLYIMSMLFLALSLSYFWLHSNMLTGFIIVVIFANFLYLAAHTHAQHELKIKGVDINGNTKDDDVQLSMIAGFTLLAEIREAHLKTDAYMINYHKMFVNTGLVLLLCSMLYTLTSPVVESNVLPDWLIEQILLFKSTYVWYFLIMHLNARNFFYILN